MSDNFFIIVPNDPRHVPTAEAQRRVAEAARLMAPNADEVSIDVSEHVAFFDAGANFERVACPLCESGIELAWWEEQMSLDFDGQGFRLAVVDLPCCGSRATLNELRYEWLQAFGRFSCKIRNPELSEISDEDRAALEAAMGMRVSLVRSHL